MGEEYWQTLSQLQAPRCFNQNITLRQYSNATLAYQVTTNYVEGYIIGVLSTEGYIIGVLSTEEYQRCFGCKLQTNSSYSWNMYRMCNGSVCDSYSTATVYLHSEDQIKHKVTLFQKELSTTKGNVIMLIEGPSPYRSSAS